MNRVNYYTSVTRTSVKLYFSSVQDDRGLEFSASQGHDRLLQLINHIKLPAVVDSLVHGPKRRNPTDLNPGCWDHLSAAQWSRRHSHAAGRPSGAR